MRKKVLASLLAVGLLFGCISVQAEAEEACNHSYTNIEVTRYPTGGYNHTYTGPGGVTKVCAVTVGTYTYNITCIYCGHVSGTGSGTFESHGTNHD